jgi:glyoxylase-like metal-dependent hydrolase (beta-lactamase superfamily II)
VYHRKVGDLVVSAVSDGFLQGNLDVMRNVDVEVARTILEMAFRPARRTSVNCFLIFTGGRIGLIDAGCGSGLSATAGKLIENLASMGITPADIDTVLMTHLHADHGAGLIDPHSGNKIFGNAEVVLHEAEMAHWHDDEAEKVAPELHRNSFFPGARKYIAPYKKDAVRLVRDQEVMPGVFAVPSPGHTPGHLAFLISSGDEQLMIWGDTVHVPEVQTLIPRAGMSFDTNLDQAAKSRARMFDRVATDKILVAGMHTHFPGFGRLARDGEGYRLYPEAWVQTLRGTEI